MNMSNITYNSSEDMINKLQELKGKTKLKISKNISNHYDEMNIGIYKFEEDPLSKNADGISKYYHEVLLLMNFLQTKPQLKNVDNKYYDLYYTVIKNRDEKEIINNFYENNENDYINFNDFTTPNHKISIKPRGTILKLKKMRSQINHFR